MFDSILRSIARGVGAGFRGLTRGIGAVGAGVGRALGGLGRDVGSMMGRIAAGAGRVIGSVGSAIGSAASAVGRGITRSLFGNPRAIGIPLPRLLLVVGLTGVSGRVVVGNLAGPTQAARPILLAPAPTESRTSGVSGTLRGSFAP